MLSVAQVITSLNPIAAIVENVPTVIGERHIHIFEEFIKSIKKRGYYVEYATLNALEFGTPQRRIRLIFFVSKFPIDGQFISNELEKHKRKPDTIRTVLSDLPSPLVRPDDYDSVKDNGCLPNHHAMKHSSDVIKKIADIPIGKGPLSYRKLNPENYSCTLISGHRAPPVHFSEPRSITTREALRLQGFPDSFRVYGRFSRQMEQVTNAVPLQLGRAVLKVMRQHIERSITHA